MAAAAHTPGGYGGVPQSVGQDFNAADAKLSPAMRKQKAQADALRKRRKAPPPMPPDPSALGSG